MWFEALLVAVAFAAGGIASVTGFGIGSLLTPLLAVQVGTKLAVAAVSIPHLAGTAFRFWLLGRRPDRGVLWSFGVMSAAGGLTGALLHGTLSSPWLTAVFGILLIFVSASEMTGLARRMRFTGAAAWAAGAASGLLGGLVGNQGGIRAAALLGFELNRHTFVATATAIGLIVDAARMPVYFWNHAGDLAGLAGWIALAAAGVLAGTIAGSRLLAHVPERVFRLIVAIVVGALGVVMILRWLGGDGS